MQGSLSRNTTKMQCIIRNKFPTHVWCYCTSSWVPWRRPVHPARSRTSCTSSRSLSRSACCRYLVRRVCLRIDGQRECGTRSRSRWTAEKKRKGENELYASSLLFNDLACMRYIWYWPPGYCMGCILIPKHKRPDRVMNWASGLLSQFHLFSTAIITNQVLSAFPDRYPNQVGIFSSSAVL